MRSTPSCLTHSALSRASGSFHIPPAFPGLPLSPRQRLQLILGHACLHPHLDRPQGWLLGIFAMPADTVRVRHGLGLLIQGGARWAVLLRSHWETATEDSTPSLLALPRTLLVLRRGAEVGGWDRAGDFPSSNAGLTGLSKWHDRKH